MFVGGEDFIRKFLFFLKIYGRQGKIFFIFFMLRMWRREKERIKNIILYILDCHHVSNILMMILIRCSMSCE